MKIHATDKRKVVLTMRSDIDAIKAEATRLKLDTKGKKKTLLDRILLDPPASCTRIRCKRKRLR